MDILELARQAGLQVLLDARIGSQTYHSVSGSLPALQRFADAIEAHARDASAAQRDSLKHHAPPARPAASTRLRKRARWLPMRRLPIGRRLQPAGSNPNAASGHAQAT
ncbi:hypothetical protein [Trinickia sp. Y13]|uniref:hypothetical protein n=1 Tax=Trinickia sp. Y13 TaxID=2917807 RepID=UPI00240554C2|nr:hypothetical protein [Trinickia sp. Y13]MDG0027570.1 hypothetical protein [Trinickia sp. Y13]